jgi:hypothetical protein
MLFARLLNLNADIIVRRRACVNPDYSWPRGARRTLRDRKSEA